MGSKSGRISDWMDELVDSLEAELPRSWIGGIGGLAETLDRATQEGRDELREAAEEQLDEMERALDRGDPLSARIHSLVSRGLFATARNL
jgi:hypothetical protein